MFLKQDFYEGVHAKSVPLVQYIQINSIPFAIQWRISMTHTNNWLFLMHFRAHGHLYLWVFESVLYTLNLRSYSWYDVFVIWTWTYESGMARIPYFLHNLCKKNYGKRTFSSRFQLFLGIFHFHLWHFKFYLWVFLCGVQLLFTVNPDVASMLYR